MLFCENSCSVFSRLATVVFSDSLCSQEERRALIARAMDNLDKNGDGTVTIHDVTQSIMVRAFGLSIGCSTGAAVVMYVLMC